MNKISIYVKKLCVVNKIWTDLHIINSFFAQGKDNTLWVDQPYYGALPFSTYGDFEDCEKGGIGFIV